MNRTTCHEGEFGESTEPVAGYFGSPPNLSAGLEKLSAERSYWQRNQSGDRQAGRMRPLSNLTYPAKGEDDVRASRV